MKRDLKIVKEVIAYIRKYLSRLRIELCAPACTCGCTCIQIERSGMTNGPEGLVRRLIPAFPRSTMVPRALTKAIVSNFDPRSKIYPSMPGHLLLFARKSSLPH